MDLNCIKISTRARNPWEALDLGFVLAKTWWRSLFLSWFLPSASLYLLLSLFFWTQPWIPVLIIWWLKPFFDQGPLYVASRALFSETKSTKEVLRALPELYRFDILPWLFWRRFSVSRAYDLPVTVLEKLKGKARAARLQHLHHYAHGVSSAASWLTFIFAHIEGLLSLGAISFVLLMLPEGLPIGLSDWILMDEGYLPALKALLSYLAMALVAPFYTMAGFCLYINRRIALEGWDIEIRFRHLASQARAKKRHHAASLSLLSVLLSVLIFSVPSAGAQSQNKLTSAEMTFADRGESKKLIKSILAEEVFHKKELVQSWRLKKQIAEQPEDTTLPEWFITLLEFLEHNESSLRKISEGFQDIAKLLEVLLWAAVLFFISYLLYIYFKAPQKTSEPITKKMADQNHPETHFRMTQDTGPIPHDLARRVHTLCEKQAYRSALSLLYGATLSKLIHEKGFAFRDDHTEAECLSIVIQNDKREIDGYLRDLTQLWQNLAYGHQDPQSAHIEGLLTQWEALFQHED